MAKDTGMQMPSSGSGIVRYFDDYKSKMQFKPAHIIVLIMCRGYFGTPGCPIVCFGRLSSTWDQMAV